MSVRHRSRLGTFLGLFGFFVVAVPACSAVLGIDALPKVEVELEASGSCAELNAMAVSLCGGPALVLCTDAGNFCTYAEGGVPEGSFPEGSIEEFTPPVDGRTPPHDACTSKTGCTTPETSPCTMEPCEGGPPQESGPPMDGETVTDGGFFESGGFG